MRGPIQKLLPEQSGLRTLSEKVNDGMICWTKRAAWESSFFILNNKLLVHRILWIIRFLYVSVPSELVLNLFSSFCQLNLDYSFSPSECVKRSQSPLDKRSLLRLLVNQQEQKKEHTYIKDKYLSILLIFI